MILTNIIVNHQFNILLKCVKFLIINKDLNAAKNIMIISINLKLILLIYYNFK